MPQSKAKSVELTEEIDVIWRRLREIRLQADKLRLEDTDLRSQLLDFIGDADEIQGTPVRVLRHEAVKLSISNQDLMETYPELFELLGGYVETQVRLYVR